MRSKLASAGASWLTRSSAQAGCGADCTTVRAVSLGGMVSWLCSSRSCLPETGVSAVTTRVSQPFSQALRDDLQRALRALGARGIVG